MSLLSRLAPAIAGSVALGAATAGFAADAAPFAARWDGGYAGAFIGASAHDITVVGGVGPLFDVDLAHAKAGLLAGYRLQRDQFLFGVEGDIGSGAVSDQDDCVASNGPYCVGAGAMSRLTFDAHLRATAGVALNERFAFFAAGGLAVARYGGGAFASVTTPAVRVYAEDLDEETLYGYSLGAGVEYRPSEGWLLRGEVLYDVYDETIPVAAVAEAEAPCGSGTCQGVASITAPYDFDHVLTARIALIRQFGGL